MTIPPDFPQEWPNTYVVQDRSNQEELQRLHLQDQLVTVVLGGSLPEQADPTQFRRVLDMACGTGGWLIELAHTFPEISQLIGVDSSKRMISFAHAQAEARQVSARVEFRLMDAFSLFAFSDDLFDLANLRFALSFLRTWEWPQVLRELRRVTRGGGIIRLTEADLPDQSTSPALLQLCSLLAQAYNQAWKYFRPQARGVAADLAGLLEQQGLHNVQTRISRPEIQSGTVAGQLFFEDMRSLFRTNVPFLQKWTRVPENYTDLYQQMLVEMQQPDFVVANQTITAWGSKP
ncbi:MAG TPA: class I SAM-dependent methyltransferase [Ktedonosporobacter sp.]|nr:class I SAM-dependent methyltransferase [Ktedonosporobacter sp.]